MMRKKTIYVTEKDVKRLRTLIKSTIATSDHGKRDIKKLIEELDRAKKVSPTDIPHTVITMNSKVCLIDIDTGKEMIWRLVYPKDQDIDQGRISILAPLGTAMLGYFEGDMFEWKVPSGKRKFKVKSILYQPEAAGNYNL